MPFELDLPLGTDAEGDARAAEFAAGLAELGNERFLRAVVGAPVRLHHRSTDRLTGRPSTRPEVTEPTSSLLLRALHLSFAGHLPLSLAPDVLWYAVVHEIAVHVRLNSAVYAGLFTATPDERQIVEVRDDRAPEDWERSINLVREPLRALIGERTADLFLPAFSTTTPADATAALVALMDVVSPYYQFRWRTLCGIPRIRLEGTAADWQLLADRARGLAAHFPALAPWFTALLPVLDTIASTAAGHGVDQEFWSSLYKYRAFSGGSQVTGWINAFFAHRYTDEGPSPRTEFGPGSAGGGQFPSHVSRVPFVWTNPVGTFGMAFLGGVLGIERDGEWIRPRLGHAVVELLPAAADHDPRLPEGWQLADVQRLTGCAEARLVDEFGTVTHEGVRLEVRCVIDVGGLCVVGTVDGEWYLGDGVPGDTAPGDTAPGDAASGGDLAEGAVGGGPYDVVCWAHSGPDLRAALEFF
ncbi:DUF4419 domain-containing protein [Kitasatospora sp. NPDC094015]|uniref:DUF4419 domain-containing protein n=1 Tax=Kitasatospora sp. NPDC094015 TaxID=3155205 RepID=UPI0033198C3D